MSSVKGLKGTSGPRARVLKSSRRAHHVKHLTRDAVSILGNAAEVVSLPVLSPIGGLDANHKSTIQPGSLAKEAGESLHCAGAIWAIAPPWKRFWRISAIIQSSDTKSCVEQNSARFIGASIGRRAGDGPELRASALALRVGADAVALGFRQRRRTVTPSYLNNQESRKSVIEKHRLSRSVAGCHALIRMLGLASARETFPGTPVMRRRTDMKTPHSIAHSRTYFWYSE
jgi:hypothetical protein